MIGALASYSHIFRSYFARSDSPDEWRIFFYIFSRLFKGVIHAEIKIHPPSADFGYCLPF